VSSSGPELTLVVVTWRSAAVLEDCLTSFVREAGGREVEVVVVDNGSFDGAEAVARHVVPNAVYVQNATNRGLPAANNQGIAAATGELLLISNPDVSYEPGSVDALVACARRHPRAAFVVPRLLHPDGSLQPSAGDLPRLREALSGRVAQHRRAGRSGFWWDGWGHDEEIQLGHGGEAAYLVRRSAVADIGVQDEHYVLDWEGIEWSRRAARGGYEVWFCPDAEVTHIGGVSIRQAQVRWIMGTHRGMYHYFADGSGPVRRVAVGAAVAGRAVAKLAALGAGRALYERARPRAPQR
jgi:N-acetylglucosaminyl-diphospho-decaprenol L-rhamnosyltransferase